MQVTAAIDLLLTMINRAQRVSAMIQSAKEQGRTSLTDEEVDELVTKNDTARAELDAAIAKAKAEGR